VNAAKTQLPFTFTCTDFSDKENYKIVIKILDSAGADLYTQSFRYSPRPDTGILFVDVSQFLIELHETDDSKSIQFKLSYQETYGSFAGTVNETSVIQSIYAAKEISSLEGSNMGKFIGDEDFPGDFLTPFENPLIWRDYKRTCNVLVDSGLATRAGTVVTFKTDELTINEAASPGTSEETETVSSTPGVYNFKIDRPGYGAQTHYVRCRCTDSSDNDLFNPLLFEVKSRCENEVPVQWVNDLGGLEQHVFQYDYDTTIQSDEGQTYERAPRQDIANVSRVTYRQVRGFTQLLTASADRLTFDQWRGLAEIKNSIDVELYQDTQGSIVNGVTIEGGLQDATDRRSEQHNYTLTLRMGPNFSYDSPPLGPAYPTDLTVSLNENSNSALSWTDNSSTEDSFQVWRSTDGVVFALHATTAANATSYTDTSVSPGNTYYYKVAAALDGEISAFTNIVSLAIPYPFVVDINTTNTSAGSSASNQFALPLISTGTYNFSIDWGDSSSDTITTWNQSEVTHTYAATGSYTVTITGIMVGWEFAETGDRLKPTDISQWGLFTLKNEGWEGCANVDVSATDTPALETDLTAAFRGCSVLTGIGGDYDTSGVNSINLMFANCPLFNQDLPWDTSSLTSAQNAFDGCLVFNGDVTGWDVSSLVNCKQMFEDCQAFTQDIGLWGSSFAPTGCQKMFIRCYLFNRDVSSWTMDNCTDFSKMFYICSVFNQDLSGWDFGAMTNGSLFQNATNVSAANTDALLNGIAALAPNIQSSVTFGTNGNRTSASDASVTTLTTSYSWTIT